MSKAEIMNRVTRSAHKVAFKFKKHSPEILVVGGVIGVVSAGAMACKATLKVNEVTDEAKENLEKIHVATEKGVTESGAVYTAEDGKKDTTIVYAQTGVKLAKLYAPAAIVGGISIVAILAGHNITRKRNVALAAAYTAVDKGFKEYRGRVIERFGEELDRELKYNIKAKEVEEIVVNEDGTESVVKSTVNVIDTDGGYSPYAKCFDCGCIGWTKDPEYNLMFLKNQERYATDALKSKGFLTLNEVYDMLGIPRTKMGMVVGWIYDEKHPVGDNYVDFGIFDIHKPANRDFVNGYERSIWLDFNVDGNIHELMN